MCVNRLEWLIQKHSPSGIEYKRLGDCCEIQKGTTPIQKAIPGEYPLVVTTSERKSSETYQFDKPSVCIPLISSRGHGVASLSQVYYQEGKFALGNILCAVTPLDGGTLSAKFLFYFLNYKKDTLIVPLMRGGANVSLSIDSLLKVKVPVPPILIQEEIVKTLETFDQYIASLSSELDVRKKQYMYCLDSLFGRDIEELQKRASSGKTSLVPLGSLGTLTRGKRFVHADATESGAQCVHYGEIYTHYGIWADKAKSFISPELAQKLRFAHKGDVIIVGAGENNIDIGIGVAWYGDAVVVHDACYIFNHNQNPKYISYYLRTTVYHQQIKKYVSEGKICSISADGLGKALIPIPSLEEQDRIVSILDKFEKLCNDKDAGIPAEIELRQLEYEYCKSQVLSF